ncbi:MAG: hypothetical protein GX856_07205 [Gammaproteobacteria bacterium]|jgi:hypothetical protein|nr:hypothetical protein [Gammaproteobacteria bacterium]
MDLIERLRAVKWEVTDDAERMPSDPAHECVFVDMRPADFRALLRESAAALEAAREDASTERRALLWLAGGDSGASSKAICHHMLGMKSDGSFPWDPSDLGRCLRLLELFPEWKPRIGEMARYSYIWSALATRWDELAAMMADEVGIDWSKGKRAPRTYDAMKDAIDQARGKGIVPEQGEGEGQA